VPRFLKTAATVGAIPACALVGMACGPSAHRVQPVVAYYVPPKEPVSADAGTPVRPPPAVVAAYVPRDAAVPVAPAPPDASAGARVAPPPPVVAAYVPRDPDPVAPPPKAPKPKPKKRR
jgi:hypothetical protein